MPFNLSSEDKAAKATEEYAQQLRDLYKHECYGSKKKECRLCSQLPESLQNIKTYHISCNMIRKLSWYLDIIGRGVVLRNIKISIPAMTFDISNIFLYISSSYF